MKIKLVEELPNNQDELVEEFRNHNYVKARVKDMVKRVVDAIFVDSNISEKGKKFLNKTITGLTKKR